MQQRQRNHADLDDSLHQQARHLKALFTYTACRYFIPHAGRVTADHLCLLYWPDIELNPQFYTNLAHRTGCPKPPEPTRTFWRFLRQHVEALLGPLLLPVGEHHFDLYANMQEVDTTSGTYHALVDAGNYTAFTHLNQDVSAALRSLVVPPMEGLIRSWMNELPEALVLLYEAWSALIRRSDGDLFSLDERGVGFLRDGMLFIHWDTFLKGSSSLLRGKASSSDLVCKQLEMLKTPFSLKNGMVRRDTTPTDGASLADLAESDKYLNRYQKALRASGLCDTLDSLQSFCTVIDPLYLFRKKNLFDGRTHKHRRAHLHHATAASRLRQRRNEAPLRPAKLHTFEFKPSLYLREPDNVVEQLKEYQWFADDHVETVYAIRRQNQFFFARPGRLSAKNDECIHEVEAWWRTLDLLNMVEVLDETGEIVGAEGKSKSKYMRDITPALQQQAGAAHVECFVSVEKTSARAMRKAMQAEEIRVQREDPSMALSTTRAGNWYTNTLARVAAQFINPNSVRRKAIVQLPYKEEPAEVVFYAPTAIHSFRKVALGSFHLLDPDDKDSVLAEAYCRNALPAPYVLAWARFCLDVQERHPDGGVYDSTDDHRDIWTPAEDAFLLECYTSKPHMTSAQWDHVLKHMPHRTQKKCATHIASYNSILKRVLSGDRLMKHRMGFRPCTPIEARRSILLVGCTRVLLRRGQPVHQRLPFIKHIFGRRDTFFEQFSMPASYNVGSFGPHLSV